MLRDLVQDNVVAKKEHDAIRAQRQRRRWRYLLPLAGLAVGLPFLVALITWPPFFHIPDGYPWAGTWLGFSMAESPSWSP